MLRSKRLSADIRLISLTSAPTSYIFRFHTIPYIYSSHAPHSPQSRRRTIESGNGARCEPRHHVTTSLAAETHGLGGSQRSGLSLAIRVKRNNDAVFVVEALAGLLATCRIQR